MFLYYIIEVVSICFCLLARPISTFPGKPDRGALIAHNTCTVYAVLPIDLGIDTASRAAALHWAKKITSIDKSATMKHAYYSQEAETSTNLNMIIGKTWSHVFSNNAIGAQLIPLAGFYSVAAAETFQKSLHSGIIYGVLKSELIGPITSYIVEFNPADPLSSLTKASVTEVATFWLPKNPNATIIGGFNSGLANLKTAVTAAQGEVYLTSGYVLGEVKNPSGQTTPAVLALVGWSSVSAHIAFTQTAAFGVAIGGILPFVSGSADHHITPAKLF